jgi:nitrogen fixation protein FixH
MKQAPASREFTGRHMLLLMLAFFGVIITVNLTMATLANTSWTGFVVKNSYVASQHFNERAAEGRAQAALGWTGELQVAAGRLIYRLRDANGAVIPLDGAHAALHRPVSAEDRTLALEPAGGGALATEADLADGAWIIEIDADAGLERPYRDVRRFFVSDGAIR